jgi:hypothetical protein
MRTRLSLPLSWFKIAIASECKSCKKIRVTTERPEYQVVRAGKKDVFWKMSLTRGEMSFRNFSRDMRKR